METDNGNEAEVKLIDKIEVIPTEDTELIDNENETQPDSSREQTKEEESTDETETENKEQLLGRQNTERREEIKDVVGETPREKALRLEITRMKREVSKYRKDDLFTPVAKPIQQPNTVLENYDSEQVKELKTILASVADELGFVKKDQLQASLNEDRRDEIWNSFLDKHPEYLSDEDGVFYNQLKEEFTLYKEPTSAKEFQKLLNKAHDTIFGTKSTPININKINAQQEKIKVASHSGGTAGSKSKPSLNSNNTANLRLDSLKGFTDEEINELFVD